MARVVVGSFSALNVSVLVPRGRTLTLKLADALGGFLIHHLHLRQTVTQSLNRNDSERLSKALASPTVMPLPTVSRGPEQSEQEKLPVDVRRYGQANND